MPSSGGTPHLPMATTISIGDSANTEPTDRSNSPAIIRMPTPSATMPSSGSANSITRMLPLEANCGA